MKVELGGKKLWLKKTAAIALMLAILPTIVEAQGGGSALQEVQLKICNILEQFYDLLVYISTGLGALMIVIMGIIWVASADDSKARTLAKTAIVHVIIGLLVISIATNLVRLVITDTNTCVASF